tara:strand:- start:284 stop:628 length:345 start_codon:yes stop_codon:yes gene_type:complete
MQISFLELEEHYVHQLCYEPTRQCRKCLRHFGKKDLNKDNQKPDGLNNICLDCHKINMEKRRAKNRQSRTQIKDWYVNDLLNKKELIKIKHPIDIIKLKNIELQLTRLLNKGKK